MKKFINDSFLLKNKYSQELFDKYLDIYLDGRFSAVQDELLEKFNSAIRG